MSRYRVPVSTEALWAGSGIASDPLTPVTYSQDILNGSTSNKPFFTSVATITVHVKDIDNRPPWYQPCVRANLGMAKLCVSTGYKGRVNLTEKEVRLQGKLSEGSSCLWLPPWLNDIIWRKQPRVSCILKGSNRKNVSTPFRSPFQVPHPHPKHMKHCCSKKL